MKLDERMTPKQGNRGSNALLTHGGALRFQYKTDGGSSVQTPLTDARKRTSA